jgi:hypothetical protein
VELVSVACVRPANRMRGGTVKAALKTRRESTLEGKRPKGATCLRRPKQLTTVTDFRVEQYPEVEGRSVGLTLWLSLFRWRTS